MTISIGTSSAPSADHTHAAWLRRREDGNRGVTEPPTTERDGRGTIARRPSPNVAAALI